MFFYTQCKRNNTQFPVRMLGVMGEIEIVSTQTHAQTDKHSMEWIEMERMNDQEVNK